MENEKLESLSLDAIKKADEMLKKSKKLKKDAEKLLKDVEETNKKYGLEEKSTSRK
jgi:hypothetical protein